MLGKLFSQLFDILKRLSKRGLSYAQSEFRKLPTKHKLVVVPSVMLTLFMMCMCIPALFTSSPQATPTPTVEISERSGSAIEVEEDLPNTSIPTNTATPSSTPTETPTSTATATKQPTSTPTIAPTATRIPPTQIPNTPVPATSIPNTPVPPPPTQAQVVIAYVDKRAEFVDIRNTGGQPQDLGGWILRSEKGSQDCALGGSIAAGATLRIWAMSEDAGQGGFNCGFGSDIWNNSVSDPAVLFNAQGAEVSRY